MSEIKIIIIDDERLARENLRSKILQYSNQFKIIGEAENIEVAKVLIDDEKPDAIFLDISMPHGSGFDLLNQYDKIDFDVIFVTAYNRFAIQAFKYFAIGYILKPIELSELNAILSHLAQKNNLPKESENLTELIKYIKNDQNIPVLAVPVESGFEFIGSDKIMHLEASDGYTTIYMKDGHSILSSKSLSYYVTLLDSQLFIQIHRSFIINLNFLKRYHKIGFVTMKNGDEIPVSKTKRSQFKNLFR
jgi:two-component system LytT family response regulator